MSTTRTILALGGALTVALAGPAAAQQQDLRNVFPEQRPPAVAPLPDPAADAVAADAPEPARPGERLVVDRLRGLVIVPTSDEVPEVRAEGVDLSRQPLLDDTLAERLAPFIDAPASVESLGRATAIVSNRLREMGYTLALVYMPQQPIVDDTVVIVARPATLDSVEVTGAEWFAAEDYRAALPVEPGRPVNGARLNEAVSFLNRNPFRDSQIVAEPGAAPGTTRLTLEARDRLPVRPFAGVDDTGTDATGNRRVFAGFDWGKPFGLADLMTYQFKADPTFKLSRAHSLSYVHYRPGGDDVTAYAAYSQTNPKIVAPFDREGDSWQVGATWRLPLVSPSPALSHAIGLGADVKASRSVLRFAGQEASDTTTHIVQGRLGYNAGLDHLGGRSTFGATLIASPGGVIGRNDDADFNAARAGAQADYAYVQLSAAHQLPLGGGFVAAVSVDGQVASGNLLGSEQFAAGGYAAVRGYPEDEAYGDHGVLASATLGLPPVQVLSAIVEGAPRDSLAPYVFLDAAKVWNADPLPGETPTTLASAGIGLDYAFGSYASGRLSLGIPLRQGRQTDRGDERAHFSLTLAY